MYSLEISYLNDYGFIEYKKFDNVVYACFRNYDVSICIYKKLDNIIIKNILDINIKKVGVIC